MQRLFLTHSLFLFPAVVGVAVLASACGHPGAATSGVGGTQGTAGNNGGLGGSDGTAGVTGGGIGGAGNVMVIGPDAGAAGMAMKMSCPSATSDPLPYTKGYAQDPTIHQMAVSLANTLSDTEKQQQMTGLP